MNRVTVQIRPGFFLSAAVAVLLIPLPWLFAWVVAAIVHELFHLIAVWLFRFSILSIVIGAGGAKIETDMPIGLKMTVSAVAGPIGGLLLLLLLRITPRIALCGLIQSIYNLLPLCHLDGGRALNGILSSLFQTSTVNQIAVLIERIVLFLLIIVAVYAFVVLKLGIVPLLFAGVLLLKNKKFLANRSSKQYNNSK